MVALSVKFPPKQLLEGSSGGVFSYSSWYKVSRDGPGISFAALDTKQLIGPFLNMCFFFDLVAVP